MKITNYNSYEAQKKAYNLIAKGYEKKMTNTFVGELNNVMNNKVINKLKLDSNKSYKIIDIGCGDGILLRKILKLYPKTQSLGIDASENLIDIAKKKSFGNINFLVGDAMSLKISTKYDIILNVSVLHRLQNPDLFIKNLNKINNEDTTYIITTMNNISPQFLLIKLIIFFSKIIKKPIQDQVAKKGFTKKQIELILRKENYKILEFETIGFFHNFLGLGTNKIILKFIDLIDKILSKIPIINKLGVFMLIKFKKQG